MYLVCSERSLGALRMDWSSWKSVSESKLSWLQHFCDRLGCWRHEETCYHSNSIKRPPGLDGVKNRQEKEEEEKNKYRFLWGDRDVTKCYIKRIQQIVLKTIWDSHNGVERVIYLKLCKLQGFVHMNQEYISTKFLSFSKSGIVKLIRLK